MVTTGLRTSPADTIGSVRVRLLVWGLTDRHVQTAEQQARSTSARIAWDFTRTDRHTEDSCPIDISDPKVIAADCGPGWAYAVYPAETVGSFDIWKDNGVGLIELDGAFESHEVPALRQALDEAAQLAAHETIAIIDGTVTIFDPAALGALLAQHKRLHERGGTLAVIGATGCIARAMRLLDIGHSVPIFASLDDALATLTDRADQ
jgi:anti-anti-sigma factor